MAKPYISKVMGSSWKPGETASSLGDKRSGTLAACPGVVRQAHSAGGQHPSRLRFLSRLLVTIRASDRCAASSPCSRSAPALRRDCVSRPLARFTSRPAASRQRCSSHFVGSCCRGSILGLPSSSQEAVLAAPAALPLAPPANHARTFSPGKWRTDQPLLAPCRIHASVATASCSVSPIPHSHSVPLRAPCGYPSLTPRSTLDKPTDTPSSQHHAAACRRSAAADPVRHPRGCRTVAALAPLAGQRS